MIPADPSPRHAAARGALLMALAVTAACASRPDPDADTAAARGAPPVTASPVNTPQTPARGSADGPVAVRRLRSEPYAFAHSSGFADSARVIARDDATWARVWEKVYQRHGEVPARPRVAFADSMVAFVALGERSTGGYGIIIESAARARDTLAITVRRTSPGPRCGTTAALTQPVDIAVMPRVVLPVRWIERAEVTQCP